MTRLFDEDLDHILEHTRQELEEVRGQRLFITGGTGFFGCWLLESLLWANERLGLKAKVTVLTRNPQAFRAKAPHLADNPAVRLLHGDVRTFPFPPGTFSHLIHAATETDARFYKQHPLEAVDTIVDGTRRTLEFACQCGTEKYLLTSSGAVYGRQPLEVSHIPEDCTGGPDQTDSGSVYAESKRLSELLCAIYQKESELQTKIARGFAFVGPYLPLDEHYAIGNFIRDGLAGEPIQVNGDGTPYRSYLYAADLAIWLWVILFRGTAGRAYNVGSEKAVSIKEMAELVAGSFEPRREVRVARQAVPGAAAERYVPRTERARQELGLEEWIDLPIAIQKTIHWHQKY
jgi:nucleoside-diphosphate-sugar epimerase